MNLFRKKYNSTTNSEKPGKKPPAIKTKYSAEFIRHYPILRYAPRYLIGVYALTVVSATLAMLLGLAETLLGGNNTPSGDAFFAICAIIGYFLGFIPGIFLLGTICPKEPSVIQEKRVGALGAGSFYSLIIMLFAGGGVVEKLIEPKTGHLPLPLKLLLVALIGGVPAAFGALGFMIYEDSKIKKNILALPEHRVFLEAAKIGDAAKVQSLLEEGADVDIMGDDCTEALLVAAFKGHSI